jgi:hypothetical protein
MAKNKVSKSESIDLLKLLENRFEKNLNRHKGILWAEVHQQLAAQPDKLWSLQQMEHTGGEPDVVGKEEQTGLILFYDCAAESPTGRRSLCYDRAGWDSRKDIKPESTVIDRANEMGIELMTESDYRALQSLGIFDAKTSSWLTTPEGVRNLGGALFGDYRYGRVFVYHNGAQSFYAARGFRGVLKV